MRSPSLREVRIGLAEVLSPIVAFREELASSWPVIIDRKSAKLRLRAGRPAFDAIEVLHGAGDLREPCRLATQAFEQAGLASPESARAAREQLDSGVLALGASWIAGEPLPRLEPRRLAQRAAAVVVGSVLNRVAVTVRPSVRKSARTHANCPACGNAPEFSIVSAAGRRLICARCDTQWSTTLTGCLGCAATDSPTVFRIPSPDIGYDLLICNACGRYLKERTRRGGTDLLVERALTAQLDAAAERRGLRL